MENDEVQDQVSTAGENAFSAGARPAVSFSGTGGLNVAVWKHKSENGPDHFSIRIDRSYKESDGNYKTTAYLRDGDLLRVQKLLNQVDDWIEQEKVKQRTAAASSRAR